MRLSRNESGTVQQPLTMVDVQRVIDRHRDALLQHPFLAGLEGPGSLEQFRRLLPRLAFFTLAFQDILRLAHERCTNPRAVAIAKSLELGDKGHEEWYLEDLKSLGIPLEVGWLFSANHEVARDVAYRLITQVLSLADDRSRLSVMLSLEAIAREFFIRVPEYAGRIGVAHGLKYFGADHLAAEESHDVFAQDGQDQLAGLELEEQVVEEVLTAVERTFEVMVVLADDLAAAMRDTAPTLASTGDQTRT